MCMGKGQILESLGDLFGFNEPDYDPYKVQRTETDPVERSDIERLRGAKETRDAILSGRINRYQFDENGNKIDNLAIQEKYIAEMEGKVRSDPTADAQVEQENRETDRQKSITSGRQEIDNAFSGFNDDYFGQYRDKYTGFYFPDIDRQYGDAVDKLTSALADRGMLESAVGATKFADTSRQHQEARSKVANDAVDASQRLRGQVEQSKSNLFAQNEASADPQGVAAQAVGQASALVAPPTYDPLGQIFSNVLDGLAPAMSGIGANRGGQRYQSPYSGSAYGSGKVVK